MMHYTFWPSNQNPCLYIRVRPRSVHLRPTIIGLPKRYPQTRESKKAPRPLFGPNPTTDHCTPGLEHATTFRRQLQQCLRSYSRSLHAGGLGKTDTGGAGVLEDDVLALEEDIAEDGDTDVGVVLNATKAGSASGREWSVVDVLSWHNLGNATDSDREVGQGGAAWESVTALGSVELGSGDLGVVSLDDGSRDIDEGGAGIKNWFTCQYMVSYATFC